MDYNSLSQEQKDELDLAMFGKDENDTCDDADCDTSYHEYDDDVHDSIADSTRAAFEVEDARAAYIKGAYRAALSLAGNALLREADQVTHSEAAEICNAARSKLGM
jgi:hypothetical protein